MSNNQYNHDPTSNFGGNIAPMGSQPGSSQEKRTTEGMPPVSAPSSSSVARNEGDSQYNMGTQNTSNNYSTGYINQNQPNNQPSYNQPGIQPQQSSFNQENYGMGFTNSAPQHPPISSGMMGAPNLSSNQPPIGQRNYQSYPQPGYSGTQTSSQEMAQNVGGMNNSGGMSHGQSQNHISTVNQPSIQSMPPVSVPQTTTPSLNTVQGEKTYEPGTLPPTSTSSRPNYVELLGISEESQQEFDKKAAL